MRRKRFCPHCGKPGGTYGTYCRPCSKIFFPPKRVPLLDRLNRKTEIVGECWEWTGKVNKNGYGELRIPSGTSHRKQARAHRISYKIYNPEWEGAECVLHTCDNRRCWNPAHLFLGTNADNVEDMVSKGRNRRGSLHQFSKLTDERVGIIRSSSESAKKLAKIFGVSASAIDLCRQRKTWRHLP